jgi:hypothetical protein
MSDSGIEERIEDHLTSHYADRGLVMHEGGRNEALRVAVAAIIATLGTEMPGVLKGVDRNYKRLRKEARPHAQDVRGSSMGREGFDEEAKAVQSMIDRAIGRTLGA